MTDVMKDKGYEHPLYSLDLSIGNSDRKDDARFFIPVPQGRLVLRPELRRRGAKLNSVACERAVCTGLSYHELDVPGFSSYGLDAAWAEGMRTWLARMMDLDQQWLRMGTDGQFGTQRRESLIRRGLALWTRLTLSARLAGLDGQIVSGKAPRRRVDLLDALTLALSRAQKSASLLAEHGFGPKDLAELAALIATLSDEHQGKDELVGGKRQLGDRIVVMRGALIGDLSRLSRVAPLVLPASTAQAVQVRRLLGIRPRAEATAETGNAQ